MKDSKFKEYETLTDGEIEVVVSEKRSASPEKGYVPAYRFDIRLPDKSEIIGCAELRVENTRNIIQYGGHIGYGIKEEYRGNRYAARACNLIKRVALDRGLKTLWITCNPDNHPSRRTYELLGCEFIEIADLPLDNDMYQRGDGQKCRYRWDLVNG